MGKVATCFPNFQWLPPASSLSDPAGPLLDVIAGGEGGGEGRFGIHFFQQMPKS